MDQRRITGGFNVAAREIFDTLIDQTPVRLYQRNNTFAQLEVNGGPDVELVAWSPSVGRMCIFEAKLTNPAPVHGFSVRHHSFATAPPSLIAGVPNLLGGKTEIQLLARDRSLVLRIEAGWILESTSSRAPLAAIA